MKKIFALMLAVVMVLSLVACSTEKSAETTMESTGSTDVSEETTAPAEPQGSRKNQVIVGLSTEITGDFSGGMITNSSTDMMINELVNDYSTMVTNRNGLYVDNPTVMKSWTRTDNEDGTATYTITINEGLLYNNGEPITAKDYVFRTMLACTPFASAMNFVSVDSDLVVGGKDAYKGKTPVLSGLRLIDDYTMSITIVKEYANYYYADTYAVMSPWNAEFWLGEGYSVADDGEGVYITYNGEQVTLEKNSANEKEFRSAMGAEKEYVSAGPYSIAKYNAATSQCTLKRNPNYAGNFEHQKPSIETIVVIRAEKATWADQLKTGGMDIFSGLAEGSDANTLQDMIDSGEPYTAVMFDRAGYGKVQFMCDIGPTQFVEVRQAIAHLMDREEFVSTFCQGYGRVVNAPYATAMQMYKDSRDFLTDNLSSYAYDTDVARRKLEDGGWTLAEDGSAWAGNGLRYKDVTDLEVNKDGCIEVDGRTLMPLKIKWYATEGNPISDLLSVKLANSDAVRKAGMEIVQTVGDFDGLLCAMYHQDPEGNKVPPEFGMINLASSFVSSVYDMSYAWTDDPEKVALGYNASYLYDMGEGGLDDLSMKMVYDVEPGDYDSYLKYWQEYILRWNQLLPEIPLYSNIMVTAVPNWLEGYEEDSFWRFQDAILYASIPGAK